MNVPIVLAILALAATAGPAFAYGHLEPVNELGTTLRENVADPAYAQVDEVLADNGGPPASRRIEYGEDNRTWQFYNDTDRDGERDEDEHNLSVGGHDLPVIEWYYVRADGNGTDHLEFNLTRENVRLRVCPDRASEDAASLASGLRCGGDLDRDGEGDAAEITDEESPVRPGKDDDPLIPPPLLP